MARRAVQGYTEKSFYDFTRFLGMIATQDPLEEGYFRHLVNFDISDTGQSVTPREGFITTSLVEIVNGVKRYINLSNKTIYFKEPNVGLYIALDLKNFKAYLFNLSRYNIADRTIPIEKEIENFDWEDVSDFLRANVEDYQSSYEAQTTFNNGDIIMFVQSTTDGGQVPGEDDPNFDPTNAVLILYYQYYNKTYTVITPDENTVIDFGVLRPCVPARLFYDPSQNPEDFNYILAYILNSDEYKDYRDKNIVRRELIYAGIDLYNGLNIGHIFSRDLVRKTLIKMSYKHPVSSVKYPFILEIVYRENEVTVGDIGFAANTLVFSAVNLEEHTSLFTDERNIAASTSIIPNPMQRLLTIEDRPDGHTNVVGPFLYVSDTFNKKYYMNSVYPAADYNIRPHFDLGPAYMTLSSEFNNKDKWAYRFDITSMDTTKISDINFIGESSSIFRSPWLTYNGPSVKPTLVFPTEFASDFDNEDLTKRHYKKNRYIINIFPKKVGSYDASGGTPDYVSKTSIGVFLEDVNSGAYIKTEQGPAGELWLIEVNKVLAKVTDKKTFYKCITDLNDLCEFYVVDLQTEKIEDTVSEYNKQWMYGDLFPTSDVDLEGVYKDGSANIKIMFPQGDAELITQTNFYPVIYSSSGLLEILKAEDDILTGSNGAALAIYPYRIELKSIGMPGIDSTNVTVFLDRSYYNEVATVADKISFKPNALDFSDDDTFVASRFYDVKEGVYSVGTSLDRLKQIPALVNFFKHGVSITFYIRPYAPEELLEEGDSKGYKTLQMLKNSWSLSSYTSRTPVLTYGYDNLSVVEMDLINEVDPIQIRNAKNFISFKDEFLVVWTENILYISEPGKYNDFKEKGKKEFGERILKVLPFKEILLVFTTQHLYAVSLFEQIVLTEAPQAKEGEQQKPAEEVSVFHWVKNTVLYNILTKEKYIDAIQVFNQMVLFYSEDGQLYFIKPSTQIDDNTRFSLQYFNKGANDILKNYHLYINERLVTYGIEQEVTKDDVQIKSLISVNFIKIIYYVPNLITYILIYDVINNRFYVQDSTSFNDVQDKLFVDSGDAFITAHNLQSYITVPYTELNEEDNNYDMSIVDNFSKVPIYTLIDTGNLNLNNHLYKRFRDLKMSIKNISTTEILFNLETTLDDVIAHTFYSPKLEIQDIDGVPYFLPVVSPDSRELIGELYKDSFANNSIFMLLNRKTVSRLVTYVSSILGMGKVISIKLQFISKGKYKVQSFGIVYKERRV